MCVCVCVCVCVCMCVCVCVHFILKLNSIQISHYATQDETIIMSDLKYILSYLPNPSARA